jgi:tripartite ATP-independent transporter DctP family solute receptor
LLLIQPILGADRAGGEEIVLKAAQILDKGHPMETALISFGELLKERSDGTLILKIMNSSDYHSERDLIEAIQMGELDLIIITTAPLYGFTTDFLKFDLPYVFPDKDIAREILDGPIGEKSLKNSVHVGLMGLAYYENGLRHISSSNKPINLPEDISGLKIRTMESRIHMSTFRAMGAIPVPLGYNDLLRYINTNLIDLQENPITVIRSGKIYEVQKYLTFTGHFYLPAPMFISYGVWNKLTPEERIILETVAKETAVLQRKISDEMSGPETLEEFKKHMTLIEVPDITPWKEATSRVHEEFLAEIGEDDLKELNLEISKLLALKGK